MFNLVKSIKSLFGGNKAPQHDARRDFEDTFAAVAFAERGEHVVAERDILGAVQREVQPRKSLGGLLHEVGLHANRAWYGHVVV